MEGPDSYKKKIKTADIRKAQNRFKKSGFCAFLLSLSAYSTVTDFAKFLGWSGFNPLPTEA